MKDEKLSDKWQTPQDLFNVLDKGGVWEGLEFEGFNFDIDLCADENNAKVRFFSKDYLNQDIQKLYKPLDNNSVKSAFINPPYSNPKPFIEKACAESKYCKIVCLVKVDTSTEWWKVFFDHRITSWGSQVGPKPGCDVIFLPKRVKFDPPQELIDSGEVWQQLICTRRETCGKVTKHPDNCSKCDNKRFKWVQKCKVCDGKGIRYICEEWSDCRFCKRKGYTALSGPSFSSALIIMDRRNV